MQKENSGLTLFGDEFSEKIRGFNWIGFQWMPAYFPMGKDNKFKPN